MEFDIVKQFFGIDNCEIVDVSDKEDDGKEYQLYRLRYNGEAETVCPDCGSKMYKHGNRTINVLDTTLGGKPVVLSIEYPRRRCSNKDCKHIWHPEIYGIDDKHNTTQRAFWDIAQRSLRGTFEDVTQDYVASSNMIRNVFIQFMNEKKKELHFKSPVFLGIDEIKIKKIGEITVITDLEHRTLYDIIEERTQAALIKYFNQLPDRDKVLWVCSDMYRPFQKAIGTTMPNAQWAVDHFHVTMKANEAIDYVRKELQKDMTAKERIKTKRGLAYTLRTRLKNLTAEEAEKIKLCRENEKHRLMAVAYDLKEDFYNIYDDNPYSKENAQKAFEEWEKSIPDDPVFEKFRQLVKTVHNFYTQVFAYWDCPIAISNGFTECTNRIIRENNLRGRGYSFEILRARTLYRKSNLEKLAAADLVEYGPLVPDYGPVFRFDSVASEETSYEEMNENIVFEEDDLYAYEKEGYIVDPETGELIPDESNQE